MKNFKILLIPIILSVTGCAPLPKNEPSDEQYAKADYGREPSNYKEKVTSYIKETLKDPDSAKIEMANPYKGWLRWNNGYEFGYYVCMRITLKIASEDIPAGGIAASL